MSKYYLVASIFNGQDFYDETPIKSLENTSLETLKDIDLFTSRHSSFELFQLVYQELKNRNYNQLSIKHMKNKESTPSYYRVITGDPDYLEAIFDMKETTYQLLGRKSTSLTVKKDSSLYKREKKKLDEILRERNVEKFNQLYQYQTTFSFLVNRYLKTDYDDISQMTRDYQMIINEFSSYKTFRYWYILNTKRAKKDWNNQKIQFQNKIRKSSKKKEPIKTIQEYEEEFEQEFIQKEKKSYDQHLISKHNLFRLDEGKEEFLEERELNEMYNTKTKIH